MKISLTPQGRPPNRVYPPGTPSLHGLASVITGVAVVCALYFGRAVLVPITLSVLLSFLLAPLVRILRRLRMGQLPSIFIAVLFSLAALLAIGALITAQLVQLAGDLPQYQVAIEQKIETVQEKTVGRADLLMGRAAATLQRIAPTKPNPPRPTGRAARNAPLVPTPVEVHEPAPTPLQLAERAFSPAIAPIETTFIVLVVTIFILLQREDLRDRLISLFGSRDLHRTTTAINDAAVRLSRYFVAQLGVNLSAGGVVAIGLAVIGVPGALLFGVITALLRFVPYIGIWIAAILAIFLAAAIQPQWTMAVYTMILFIVVDVVAGQIAEPLLYGHRSGLSPLAVVVAAIFWSWLWGPVGLVLSTPLTLCVVTLGRYADRLNFLTVLLGDQPALTPAQNFYQRLLADDPHEAIVQAERLLKDMSLIDYYDNVVLEGLKLARNDAMRGVLMPDQLARINDALVDIVENLEVTDGVPDRLAPTEYIEAPASSAAHTADLSGRHDVLSASELAARRAQVKTSVLCVPGRGAFDEVTTAIAVQLLTRQGLAPHAATHSGYRSASADEPAFRDSPIIAIVSLDAPESPPYLRNMLRRTREWRPLATVVVGVGSSVEEDAAGVAAANVMRSADDAGSVDSTGAGAAGPAGPTGPLSSARTFRVLLEECQLAAMLMAQRQPSQTLAD